MKCTNIRFINLLNITLLTICASSRIALQIYKLVYFPVVGHMLITELVNEREISSSLANLQAFQYSGYIVGPLLGGLLASHYG